MLEHGLRWALVALLVIYLSRLVYELVGVLFLYKIEGREGFYAAHAQRSGQSPDRLEWALLLNIVAWPLVWVLNDPHFFAARLGTLSRDAEAEYRRTHPNWKPRPRR